MLRAIIFDCDGVIVNSEPSHFAAFQQTLASEGIPLSREEYYTTYLALDDKGCFEKVLAYHNRPADIATLKRLILQKKALYQNLSREKLHIYPGVTDFVRKIEGRYKLAIASGAFRAEIKEALDQAHIRDAFPVIISAQDVKQGKPHPEPFLTALAKINNLYAPHPLITPCECAVIEDSIHGVMAAREAGMKTVAVTNSYPREKFIGLADKVVGSLEELLPEQIESLCMTDSNRG